MSISSKTSPVVCLFGPTGVGKTDLLLHRLPPGFEVVAVDSIQVYRGFDIGSAKPTRDERNLVRHHLIDIRSPEQSFDVGEFVHEATSAVEDIRRRGLVPVLSGGTAFYFLNFCQGLPSTPLSDPLIRQEVSLEWSALGEVAFRRRLAEHDPASAAKIQSGDSYRLQRAWEVWLQTGQPLSSFGRSGPWGGPLFLAGLDRPRPELYDSINHRVEQMFDLGLEEEVRGLVKAGWGPQTAAMKGIGYAEWFPWLLDGVGTRERVQELIALHSRHYAKRQLTFFRSIPGVRWYHPENWKELVGDLRGWSLTNKLGWC